MLRWALGMQQAAARLHRAWPPAAGSSLLHGLAAEMRASLRGAAWDAALQRELAQVRSLEHNRTCMWPVPCGAVCIVTSGAAFVDNHGQAWHLAAGAAGQASSRAGRRYAAGGSRGSRPCSGCRICQTSASEAGSSSLPGGLCGQSWRSAVSRAASPCRRPADMRHCSGTFTRCQPNGC